MNENAKEQLEAHLLRIESIADGWTEAERHERTQELIIGLINSGFLLDESIMAVINDFRSGVISFGQLSIAFQKSFRD